jgi:hypothetical protein
MPSISIKRSMSPDGKIDSVSVEFTIEAELTDQQSVLDAIAITDAYASYVNAKTPAPRNGGTTSVGVVASSGALETVSGTIQAVYEGEVSKMSGKRGPGAIIINGMKVKSFDANIIKHAQECKAGGTNVNITYQVNDKWKSNDVKTLTAAV